MPGAESEQSPTSAALVEAASSMQLWSETGSLDALRHGIELMRFIVANAADETGSLAACAKLGAALQLLYEADQDADPHVSIRLVNESVEIHRALVDALPEGEMRQRQRANLANVLRLHYEAVGDDESLFLGIRAARHALTVPPWDSIGAQRGSTLALLLGARYALLGGLADIGEAIDLLERALSVDLNGDQRRRILSNLSQALLARGYRLQRTSDVSRALDLAKQALADAPSGDRAGLLTNAGLAALECFRLTREPDFIIEAVGHLESAARLGGTATERSGQLLNVSVAHRLLHEASGSPADLERALSAGLEARVHAAQPSDQAAAEAALGRTYWARYQATGAARDARAAIDVRARVSHDKQAPVFTRFDSARTAGDWSMTVGDPAAASVHYGEALDLVPYLGWLALDGSSQEHEAARLAGLSSDAAAAALGCSDAKQALYDIDRGRTVIWRQRLDLSTELPTGFDAPSSLSLLRQAELGSSPDRAGPAVHDGD